MAPKSNKSAKIVHESASDSESSSSAESTRQVEESSESSSESENESATSSGKHLQSSTNGQKGPKSSQAESSRPSRPYKAPFGFKSAKNQPLPAPSTSALLSDLRGKQVFHITAPSFLPLSKVKEVSLAQALQGAPVLKHDGVKYGLPADSQTQSGVSGQTLFLYDTKTATYYRTAADVPTYHIQEMVDLPGGAEYDEMAIKAVKALEKPPRKQPRHLKMRFRPVGSGNAPPETIGSSSEESDAEEPKFIVPIGLEKEKERKRKHQQTEGDGSQPAAEPRKKSKKVSGDLDESGAKEKSKRSSKDRDGKKRKKEKSG